MNLTCKQKNTYQIICDDQGYVGACYIITNTDIFGDNVYMVTTSSQIQVPLDKMKIIVSELKG